MDLLTKNNYKWPGRYTPFDHQRATAEFLVRYPRAFCFNDIGCVDAKTEYLSPTGWQRIDSYKSGQVAQYNIDTGQAEFVDPEGYIKLPCGEFYHIKTKYGIDQMLSEEHRVLYVGSTNKKAVRPMKEIAEHHWKAKYGFKGRIITTFKAPDKSGIDLTDAQLRLMVAVIADGHFPDNNNMQTCIVRLKRKRKIKRLKQLLSKAKILYTFRLCKPTGFRVFAFDAPLKKKKFDSYFWGANDHQLRIIAEECVYWDGTFRKSDGVTFASTEKESADFIQYCFSTTRQTASLGINHQHRKHPTYNVYARNNNKPLYITGWTADRCRYDNIKKVQTPGEYKYCFAVPSTYLILRRNGRIFVTGNTSKTISALWASDFLMHHGAVKKVLISAPLSTLWTVWYNEIWQNIFHRKSVVLHGSREKRLEMLKENVDFYIINHEGIQVIWHELNARKDINLVILDESAKLRNARTDKWRAANSFCGYSSGRKLWCLTGAPMPRGPEDAWGQAKLVNPNLVPKYFTRFRDEMMIKINMFKWAPVKGWEDKCFKILQPSIRFTRDECIDLPDCTTQTLQVDMSKEQTKAYNDLMNALQTEFEEGRVTAINEAAKRIKLMQVAAGAVYDGDSFVHNIDCKPKLCMLKETVESAGNKALVFVSFRHSTPLISEYLKKQGLSVEAVFGDTPVKKRQQVFSSFQHRDLQIIVAHPGCMAHGLTLTASHTIIWWAPVDSYETYEQANGRITRPGQSSKQTIIHLVCSEIERKIYQRLRRKEKMQGVLLDLLNENKGGVK